MLVSEHPSPQASPQTQALRSAPPGARRGPPPFPSEKPPPHRPPCKSRAGRARGAARAPAAPTLHTRSPARAPVYSVPVYVGLTV